LLYEPIYKFPKFGYNIYNKDLERIKQMTSTPTTTREYLKTQGISVGKRGRFSAAALGVISKAAQEGVVFTDKKNVK
jgi:hypothetical protein